LDRLGKDENRNDNRALHALHRDLSAARPVTVPNLWRHGSMLRVVGSPCRRMMISFSFEMVTVL
jgi:hypothetical protein